MKTMKRVVTSNGQLTCILVHRMAYFIVQMRDDNEWVLVPKRWMSQSHRMFYRPDCDWKGVAELDEGCAEEKDKKWIRCYIHDHIVTADNLKDGLEKLALKCPKPQPPSQPGPSVDNNLEDGSEQLGRKRSRLQAMNQPDSSDHVHRNTMDFTKINKIARRSKFLPTKQMQDLEEFKYYKVTNLRKVKPEFGYIVADVEETFSMFLPTHIADALNDDDSEFRKMLRAAEENRLQMRYLGKYQIEFNCL